MNLFRSLKKATLASPTHLHSRRDFSRFYDEYAPMLYGYLLGRSEDASLADSILVDVFFTLWQDRVAFNENQSTPTRQAPLSWLLHIAHRKELEHLGAVKSCNLIT